MSFRSEHREDGESTSSSSEASEAKTDRYGFLLANGETQNHGSDDLCPELVRHREMKWLSLISQWDQVIEKKANKIKAQCQKGIPASVRSKCWPLLCGAAERMKKNVDLYKTLESAPGQQSWIDVIKRDTDRQFPFHEMFQSKDGQGQQCLLQVLKAYTEFRPDEGYCQAQGPVAAVLLMNLPTEEAFWCLVQISELYLPGYYSPLLEGVLFDAAILSAVLKKTCPAAHKHMQRQGVEPLMFATDWLMCLYSRHLPFNTLLRVWDLFFCYGARVLFQVAVVLVRRCLGEARQRKECEGQMDTLEQLRAVRERVQHEQADAFIQEVCSVHLSLAELQRQTDKVFDKWRNEHPGSTFDPRNRCHGYYMVWEKAREREEEQENEIKKERSAGNRLVPVTRSHSSLSPAILRKKWRKRGSKVETEEWEGGGRRSSQVKREEVESRERTARTASVSSTTGEVQKERTPQEFSIQSEKDCNTHPDTGQKSEAEETHSCERSDKNTPVFVEEEEKDTSHNVVITVSVGQEEETKQSTGLNEDEAKSPDGTAPQTVIGPSQDGTKVGETMTVQDDKDKHQVESETKQEKQEGATSAKSEDETLSDEVKQEEEFQIGTINQKEEEEFRLSTINQQEFQLSTINQEEEEEFQLVTINQEEEFQLVTINQEEEFQLVTINQEEEFQLVTINQEEEELQLSTIKQEKEELQLSTIKQEEEELQLGTINQEEEEFRLSTINQQEEQEFRLSTINQQEEFQPGTINQEEEEEFQLGTINQEEEEEFQLSPINQEEEFQLSPINQEEEEFQLSPINQEKEEFQLSTINQEEGFQLSTCNEEEKLENINCESKEEIQIYVSKDGQEIDIKSKIEETDLQSRTCNETQVHISKQEESIEIQSCKQDKEMKYTSIPQEEEVNSTEHVEFDTHADTQEREIQLSSCEHEQKKKVCGPEEEVQLKSEQEKDISSDSAKEEVEIQLNSNKLQEEKEANHNNDKEKLQEFPTDQEVMQEELKHEVQEGLDQEIVSEIGEDGQVHTFTHLEKVATESPRTKFHGHESETVLKEEKEGEGMAQVRGSPGEGTILEDHSVNDETSKAAATATCVPTQHQPETTSGPSDSQEDSADQQAQENKQGTPVSRPDIQPVICKDPKSSSGSEPELPPNIQVASLKEEPSMLVQSNPVTPASSSSNPSSHPHLRLRRSSSSQSHPTILSEDTFREPHHSDKDATQDTTPEPPPASTKQTPAPDTAFKAQTLPTESKADKPKRRGLFHLLKADSPTKSNIPKILIQDFSEGEEKLSSRERRRRRREQERKEKEEEKERKRREKELEKEKQKERKKIQTRGRSFQMLSRKHDDSSIPVSSHTGMAKRNSVPYTDSYF